MLKPAEKKMEARESKPHRVGKRPKYRGGICPSDQVAGVAEFKGPPDHFDRVGELLLDALQRRLREIAERADVIASDIDADDAHHPWLMTTLPKCAPLI